MTRRRLMVAVLLGTLALASSPDRVEASVGNAVETALVRVVAAAPGLGELPQPVAIDGLRLAELSFGQATAFQRTPAGTREVSIGDATLTAILEPGCLHTLVVVQPRGLDSPVELLDAAECDRRRTAPGAASVRFIHATTDSAPASLVIGGTRTETLERFSVAGRVEVPAGTLAAEVRSAATGERLGAATVALLADGAMTALWAGGGEANLVLLTFGDGTQPHRQPEGPIHTGLPDGAGTAARPLAAVALTVALAGAAGWVVRRRLAPACVALLITMGLAGCSAGPPATGAPVPSPVGPPATVEPTSPSDDGGKPSVAAPVTLEIPKLGVAASVAPWSFERLADILGGLPVDQVAWFSETARPGQVGAALIAGHGPANGRGVFGRLHELVPGDEVVIDDADGQSRRFTVSHSVVADKGQLPEGPFAFTPEATIILATCAGPTDRASGLSRQNLLVVLLASE